MPCSSCKLLLDRYLEGTLATRQLLAVRTHLDECQSCTALLDELKVVDALLTTLRPPEPVANFTFAVMAEVRSLPVPAVPRAYLGALLGGYIIIAWAIIALWLRLAGVSAQAAFANAGAALAGFARITHALAASALGTFGHGAPYVTTLVLSILALDLTVAAGVAIVYVVVRPRLAAHLASFPEGS